MARRVALGLAISPAKMNVIGKTDTHSCPWGCGKNVDADWEHVAWDCPRRRPSTTLGRWPDKPSVVSQIRWGWASSNPPNDYDEAVMDWLCEVGTLLTDAQKEWAREGRQTQKQEQRPHGQPSGTEQDRTGTTSGTHIVQSCAKSDHPSRARLKPRLRLRSKRTMRSEALAEELHCDIDELSSWVGFA